MTKGAPLTTEQLQDVLECLAFKDARITVAMESVGAGVSTFWNLVKRARETGEPTVRWPDRSHKAAPISFDKAVNLARKIQIAQSEAVLRAQFAQAMGDSERDLRDASGKIDYYVYEDRSRKSVRIHRDDCGYCQFGQGKNGGNSRFSGKWHGPYSRAEAFRVAQQLNEKNNAPCTRCAP